MKAISLWEPWGTAIARGLKCNETRGFSTHYRGPLAIHCAKTTVAALEIWKCGEGKPLREALATVGVHSIADLAFGKIVAVCELGVCVRVGETPSLRSLERLFGNYEPGRFVWMLRDIRALKVPVPFRGRQGFFEVPDDVIERGLA